MLCPGDDGYDEARRVDNGMIDRRPSIIVRCVDDADVIGAVNAAREHQLPLSVRGGGHNPNGFAVNDDGLVIDLSAMNGVWVDAEARRVRVQGGCTWGDVDHATHAFGLAVPGGLVSTTGVGGLTLGGGIGHLTRAYGLSCDNLLSADVVTAAGERVTASAQENPDLYWALRGGGGNFGVVTSFEFRGNPVHTVLGGVILYPMEQAAEAMRFYRDFLADAPDEMSGFFVFHLVAPEPPFPEHLHNTVVCGVICCYAGAALERGEELLEPLLEFGPPVFEHVERMPLPALQSAFDEPPGSRQYWKADFFDALHDEVIDIHLEFARRIPTPLTAVHVYPINGKAHQLSNTDTAWSYRDASFSQLIGAGWLDPADDEQNRQWVRDYWEALHPYSSGGGQVNFMHDEDDARTAAAYRGNYQRLAQIKAKYDPDNLFRLNQNIKPQA